MTGDVVRLLAEAGAPAEAVGVALRLIEDREIPQQVLAQRVRRIRETQERHARQRAEKPALTERAVKAFAHTCQYCQRPGTDDRGPDHLAWNLDRITPGRHGGEYTAENVTLACRDCNVKKGAALPWARPASLADAERAA